MKKGPNGMAGKIEEYLQHYNPLGLRGARVVLVGTGNHLIFKVEKDGRTYALRMINPDSYRAGEWLSMQGEYQVLRGLSGTGLGPEVYFLQPQGSMYCPPFTLEEFVGNAICYNELKPLSRKHLRSAAHAIADLNVQDFSPQRLPFMAPYAQPTSFGREGMKWIGGLQEAVQRMGYGETSRWVFRLVPLCYRAYFRLRPAARIFKMMPGSFHFDGAHTGNTYLRNGRTMFLDWQKVSWRNDPTFTLVRFAISADTQKGRVDEEVFQTLIEAYLEHHPVPNFEFMARARLLERLVSDAIWVIWDYARKPPEDRRGSLEEATSIVERYDHLSALLKQRIS